MVEVYPTGQAEPERAALGSVVVCEGQAEDRYGAAVLASARLESQGDGSGLRAIDSKVGRIGQLACWEHYNPLARYALMVDGEQIHSAMYPGSIFADLFAQQTEINVRQHALESACFVGANAVSASKCMPWPQ